MELIGSMSTPANHLFLGGYSQNYPRSFLRVLNFLLLESLLNIRPERGVRKLTGENLKLVWAEFSTLS